MHFHYSYNTYRGSGANGLGKLAGKENEVWSGTSIELLYGTIILHFNCPLSRAPSWQTVLIAARYMNYFACPYIMHVKIVRKSGIPPRRDDRAEKRDSESERPRGGEVGGRVRYSCVSIMRCYALLVIRFIRAPKFANFVPRKTRAFRIPFDTRVRRIGMRIFSMARILVRPMSF